MGSVSALAGRRFYLDANVFVYALEALSPWAQVTSSLFRLIDAGHATGLTSEFTLMECLVKPLRLNNSVLAQVYLDALRDRSELRLLPVSRPVLIEAARLRANHPTLKPPDALHLASASMHAADIFLTNDARLSSVGMALNVELLSALTP